MPDSVHVPTRWAHSSSPRAAMARDTGEAIANAAGAVEMAARAAVGYAGVRAVSGTVRSHPLLSLLFAAGIGYMVAKSRKAIRQGKSDLGRGRGESRGS